MDASRIVCTSPLHARGAPYPFRRRRPRADRVISRAGEGLSSSTTTATATAGGRAHLWRDPSRPARQRPHSPTFIRATFVRENIPASPPILDVEIEPGRASPMRGPRGRHFGSRSTSPAPFATRRRMGAALMLEGWSAPSHCLPPPAARPPTAHSLALDAAVPTLPTRRRQARRGVAGDGATLPSSSLDPAAGQPMRLHASLREQPLILSSTAAAGGEQRCRHAVLRDGGSGTLCRADGAHPFRASRPQRAAYARRARRQLSAQAPSSHRRMPARLVGRSRAPPDRVKRGAAPRTFQLSARHALARRAGRLRACLARSIGVTGPRVHAQITDNIARMGRDFNGTGATTRGRDSSMYLNLRWSPPGWPAREDHNLGAKRPTRADATPARHSRTAAVRQLRRPRLRPTRSRARLFRPCRRLAQTDLMREDHRRRPRPGRRARALARGDGATHIEAATGWRGWAASRPGLQL